MAAPKGLSAQLQSPSCWAQTSVELLGSQVCLFLGVRSTPPPSLHLHALSSGLLASFEFLQWIVQPLPQGLWTCCSLFPLFPVNTYSPFRVELNVTFLGCLFWPIRLSFVLLLPITVSLITGLVKMWIGLWTDALPLPHGQAGSRASLRHPCTCVVLKAGDQLIQQRWVSLPTC